MSEFLFVATMSERARRLMIEITEDSIPLSYATDSEILLLMHDGYVESNGLCWVASSEGIELYNKIVEYGFADR
jgi:hypothetical protein